MNSYTRLLALALILAGGSTVSVAQTPPERAPAAAQPAAPDTSGMQANMQKMHALMLRIGQTADPAERRRMLAEHRDLMRQQITALKDMRCDTNMMGGGMGMMGGTGTMSGASRDGRPPGGAPPCHEMMEMRMQMMTGMMEQMLLHQEAEQSAAPKR